MTDRHEFSDQEELDRLTASVQRDGRILRTMFLALAFGGLGLIVCGIAGWL